ncbi:MAG: UDP-glucose 4-epimerase [Thermoleophilaceae bacterium]|nr:UDP-glucose 4-epimerase [Thermoleophilaceae bacterium]
MRAIVLGGSGFVGSHVADALVDAGHEVSVFDLAPSRWLAPEQQYIAGDVTDADAVAAAIDGHDVVYNFAGLADIDECRERPLDTVRVNVAGNVNALEGARRAGVKRYVFASTIYVASESGSFYRVSKQACESYIEEYEREHGVPYTILRFGTLYGRRASDTNSVHRYLKQALLDRSIVAEASGEELREYIHVEDAARLSVEVLADEFAHQQVVLTGHHALRFRDLLNLIQEIVGPDVSIELKAPSEDSGSAHYSITPYHFRPQLPRKLIGTQYTDLGQGLIDCLRELHDLNVTER